MAVLDVNDTIAAIASAPGNAIRGIIRLSGPDSISVLSSCTVDSIVGPTTANRIHSRIQTSQLGNIECDLLIWPNEKSFTRQPSAEIHTVGSPVILNHVLQSLLAKGARLAQNGEFTMRAFLAGRIDLTQAEAVLGVIDASNQNEFQTALKQLSGGLLHPLQKLRDQLILLIADVEAELDFVEEDIEFVSQQQLDAQLAEITAQISTIIKKISHRSVANELPKIVLYGPPNAGKSTLFNRLCPDSSAIVSEKAGTTRDFVIGRLTIDDQLFEVIDTAGVHSSWLEPVDAASQEKSREQLQQATIRILCIDSSKPLSSAEHRLLEQKEFDFVFLLKSDLPSQVELKDQKQKFVVTCEPNSTTPDELQQALNSIAEESQTRQLSEFVPATVTRCKRCLIEANDSLSRARSLLPVDRELLAADLRLALNQLGEIVGVVYTDDILDRIFSRFCIGK